MATWQESVNKTVDKPKLPDNWNDIKNELIEKQHRRCFRCDKKFPKYKLSIHHILPRIDGGGDNIENLMVLCIQCHDLVESKNCKSKSDILSTIESDIAQTQIKEYEETEEKIDWHKVVYGGIKAKGRKIV